MPNQKYKNSNNNIGPEGAKSSRGFIKLVCKFSSNFSRGYFFSWIIMEAFMDRFFHKSVVLSKNAEKACEKNIVFFQSDEN